MFAIGLVQAGAGIMRHRFAVTNWLTAAYRTVQLVTRQATHLGATLPKRVATGEVVAIGTNDLSHIGNAMDVHRPRSPARSSSFLVVAVILLAPRSRSAWWCWSAYPAAAADRARCSSRCSVATSPSAR